MAKKELTTKKEEVAAEAKLIIAPLLTEKASQLSENNAYTFVVSLKTTKLTLLSEIKKTYKVTPKAIKIISVKGKNVFVRGKKGVTAPSKKAIVFLKKGDTIALA